MTLSAPQAEEVKRLEASKTRAAPAPHIGAVLGCPGCLSWAVLGCPGLSWVVVLGCPGLSWDAHTAVLGCPDPPLGGGAQAIAKADGTWFNDQWFKPYGLNQFSEKQRNLGQTRNVIYLDCCKCYKGATIKMVFTADVQHQ